MLRQFLEFHFDNCNIDGGYMYMFCKLFLKLYSETYFTLHDSNEFCAKKTCFKNTQLKCIENI